MFVSHPKPLFLVNFHVSGWEIGKWKQSEIEVSKFLCGFPINSGFPMFSYPKPLFPMGFSMFFQVTSQGPWTWHLDGPSNDEEMVDFMVV